MKKLLLFIVVLAAASGFISAQNRTIARGAEPGELYWTGNWYGIFNPIFPMYFDTLRSAVFRITENGKKLTIQYDADYFAEYYTLFDSVMLPAHILTDATSGVVYLRHPYFKNSYPHTSLWVSFDYGKNWMFREENVGSKGYFAENIEGLIYRTGMDGIFKSEDYGNIFLKTEVGSAGSEPGLQKDEAFAVWTYNSYKGRLRHTYDRWITYTEASIDSQFVFGSIGGIQPDVYRGGLPGEVYTTSWFPDYTFKVSFSADTGHTFRHVYVSDPYLPHLLSTLVFMSDREPGVFYLIKYYEIEDFNFWGLHVKICIDYYRDYGETLVATYCHDLHKDYGKTCEAVTNLSSEKYNNNSVLLTWSEPESSLPVEEYSIYRNDKLLSVTVTTSFFDENLPADEYEYYVVTYYEMGCISAASNRVIETIENDCEAITDLTAAIISNNSILLTWSEPENIVQIEKYSVFRNDILLTEVADTSYLDENLPGGTYEYYLFTYYTNGCISDTSNRVTENIDVGMGEIGGMKGIEVFPNPTRGELIIENGELRMENVEIFDVFGRLVSNLKSQISNQIINISHFPPGIYFLRITTENEIVNRKIVKY